MARTLIQPLQERPAPFGAANSQGFSPATTRHADQPMRPGIGLMVASAASIGLWVGLAKLALAAMR